MSAVTVMISPTCPNVVASFGVNPKSMADSSRVAPIAKGIPQRTGDF